MTRKLNDFVKIMYILYSKYQIYIKGLDTNTTSLNCVLFNVGVLNMHRNPLFYLLYFILEIINFLINLKNDKGKNKKKIKKIKNSLQNLVLF
jgi:hypothetical protein